MTRGKRERAQPDAQLYVVDTIVDRRPMEDDPTNFEYRVRWKSYAPEEDTWEPAEGLEHLDAFKSFVKRHESVLALPSEDDDEPGIVRIIGAMKKEDQFYFRVDIEVGDRTSESVVAVSELKVKRPQTLIDYLLARLRLRTKPKAS